MKKIFLVLMIGILLSSIPARILASGPPPPSSSSSTVPAVALGAIVAGYFLFFGGSSSTAAAKATGNEFQDLNNNPAFKNLLNQAAGGSLNTLEILK